MSCNVVWCGDSITSGNHVNPGECYPELVAATLPITSHNIGQGSATCDSTGQAALAVTQFDATKLVNLCYILFGANDGASKSAAQFASDLATFVATVQAARFIAVPVTMLPCGAYDSVAFRSASNALTLSTYPRAVDLGKVSTVMGNEAAKNDALLYIEGATGEGVHPTALGNTYLTSAFIASIQTIARDGFTGLQILRQPA